MGPGKPLGKLSNRSLSTFGATLDFYDGIPQLFLDLQMIAMEHVVSKPSVEFYIISGGLEAIIKA